MQQTELRRYKVFESLKNVHSLIQAELKWRI